MIADTWLVLTYARYCSDGFPRIKFLLYDPHFTVDVIEVQREVTQLLWESQL